MLRLRKIIIFHIHFLNMDIARSLIVGLACFKTGIHGIETHLEGIVSPKFEIGLSFNLIASRRGDFNKITKIH